MMVTTHMQRTDQRTAALTAGIALIIMTLASFFSYGYVHASLMVQGDASATFHNILSSIMLFKAEILGWLLILIADIVVAWAFYLVLKPIHQGLSLLGTWFRLMYTAILGIAILNLLFVLQLTTSADHSAISDQLQTQAMLYVRAFDSIWSIGLIIFGGHLLIVGCVKLVQALSIIHYSQTYSHDQIEWGRNDNNPQRFPQLNRHEVIKKLMNENRDNQIMIQIIEYRYHDRDRDNRDQEADNIQH